MNHVKFFSFVVAASLVLTAMAFAGPPNNSTAQFTAEKLSTIEDNLVLCLMSNSPGVRATAALTIKQLRELAPEYSFNRSIIPLMALVKQEDVDVPSRIAASLALHSIQSSRGDYAIKMTARFTDIERVKRLCENLTYARILEAVGSE
jgi:HEAT repeat protein